MKKHTWVKVANLQGEARGGGPLVGALGCLLWLILKEFGETSFIVTLEEAA